MKKILLALVLVLAFAPIALAEELPETEANGVETAVEKSLEATSGLESAEAEANMTADAMDQVLPQSALTIATKEAANDYSCPPYTIYCFRDYQCNNFCGGPGTGVCEFGCCACAF